MPASSTERLFSMRTRLRRASNCSERLRTKRGKPLGAGNQLGQVRHHLAAVAHAQRERRRAREELAQLGARARVEQDRLGPAAAGAQHVAVAEAAARREALKVLQADAALEQVAHVHVDGGEAGAVEGGRHLELPVDALLAQDRDARSRARRSWR